MEISFVFSNELKFRLARHVFFWILMFVYQGAVDFVVPTYFEGAQHNVLKEALVRLIVYTPGQIILVYSLLYFIIPRYLLKGRYFLGIIILILFAVLSGFANELSHQVFYGHLQSAGKNSLGMHRVLGVAGFAACIKFMKYWYEKQNMNTILEKEKLKAELQSLKAQIHPHFLFNTLNNIYAVTQNSSPEASDMIHRLSALLRYILYECNRPEIGLTQEFKIIGDYISLERIRYNENLDLHIQFPANTDHLLIAPLLLVPLVENCFKHGISEVIDQPWINIQADVKGNILNVRLINSKPGGVPSDKDDSGIGLSNVKKRLELLYPGKFDLKILPEPDLFVVALKIELRNPTELLNEQAR